MLAQAREIVERTLSPLGYDRFFEEFVGRAPCLVPHGNRAGRLAMRPKDTRQAILDRFDEFAPRITSHAAAPTGPAPGARRVEGADAFAALIADHHARGHTVRIPDTEDISPQFEDFVRALEEVMLVDVDAAIFWSSAGLEAPVHYDNWDILVIQLHGRKRWYVSSDTALLPNAWTRIGETSPELGAAYQFDVGPGDLLYLPRGTAHTVSSTEESLHLSIGFTPMTVRDAIIAALDRVSDADRALRIGAGARADDIAHERGDDRLQAAIREGIERIGRECASRAFIRDALDHRTSRFVSERPGLRKPRSRTKLTPRSRIRHARHAFAKIIACPDTVDVSQPGGHILVHPGAERSLRYMVSEPEFAIGDIPGELDEEVKIALVDRFIQSGLLEPVRK